MVTKKFKVELWKLLERYGIWQDYKHKIWDKELRNEFWNDILKLCQKHESLQKRT